MKKSFTVIIIVFLLICVGCSKGGNNDINKIKDINPITLEEFLKSDGYKKMGTILCDQIKDGNIKRIGYINQNETETYMINSSKEKFNISLKLYSTTKQNCEKSTDTKETNMVSNLILNNAVDVYASYTNDRSFVILNDNTLVKINTDDIVVDNHGNKTYHGKLDKVTINLKNPSEKLISLNGWGDYPILKTDKGYYSLTKKNINEYECSTYEDVKCQYEYVYDTDGISDFYNEILYYGGGILMDKSMNIYTKNVA